MDIIRPYTSLSIPDDWEKLSSDCPYQFVLMKNPSPEYEYVSEAYFKSMTAQIKNIWRVQNIDLWNFYSAKKQQLKNIKGIDPNEHMLFHGTNSQYVESICTYNFDYRLSGNHASVYGKGIYFANRARYASQYCYIDKVLDLAHKQTYKLILARVIVGEITQGQSYYTRPPQKSFHKLTYYDTCVNNVLTPTIYIVFDPNQIYPEYVIEFTNI
ncbi:putative poly (ADP-ribose) polymerase-like protein [Namao virus]|nr:putative poly (ADP-ribose) polymerase-like protein [Namao virus]